MEIKRKLAKLSPFFQSAVVIAIAALFVCSVVYAATTIGTNITTAGTLSVTGNATTSGVLIVGTAALENATTTNKLGVIGGAYIFGSATTTSKLMIGTSDLTYDATSTLNVIGTAYVFGKATTSDALSVGITAAAGNLDMAGGDLYVQDGLEVDGVAYFNRATSTSATSTNYLYIGPDGTENNLNFTGGDLYVRDDVEIDGSIWFDNGTTTDSLTIGGYASTTGDLIVSGGTFSLASGTATTTAGLFIGETRGTGTTTLGVGNVGQVGCIELTREALWYYCYLNDAKTGIVCALGRCN